MPSSDLIGYEQRTGIYATTTVGGDPLYVLHLRTAAVVQLVLQCISLMMMLHAIRWEHCCSFPALRPLIFPLASPRTQKR